MGGAEQPQMQQRSPGMVGFAPTGGRAGGHNAQLLPADPKQRRTGACGVRRSKPPAAMPPGWRKKPARITAFARLIVVGVRVSALLPREGRRSWPCQPQHLPGHTGRIAPPTAPVVRSRVTPGRRVWRAVDQPRVYHRERVQAPPLLG